MLLDRTPPQPAARIDRVHEAESETPMGRHRIHRKRNDESMKEHRSGVLQVLYNV